MMDYTGLPSITAIQKDYDILHEYAIEAVTCCPDDLRNKRFDKHVAPHTKVTHKCWGRDMWVLFDFLPRSLRNMVNDEPSNPDEALSCAISIWQEIISKATKATDRILNYESAVHGIDSLPDWLRDEKDPVIEKIRELYNERQELLKKQLEEAAERKKEREREAKRKASRPVRTYYVPPTTMVDWRVKEDGKWKTLREYEHEVNLRRVPPHIARQLIAEKKAELFEMKKITWTRPAMIVTDDPSKEKPFEEQPPLKFHPLNFSRGKNY